MTWLKINNFYLPYLVVPLLTKLGSSIISPCGEPDCSIFCKSISARNSPIFKIGCFTVVNCGLDTWFKKTPS
ncbi:hypothetical protein LBAT_1521 [Lactobacillus acetotolerans]|uniref:Uncharacterized protein n=1 Tax=Lactobacillus acetotolerans TaxID=1600 RepID=A0A0D6A634_9LACO|nr:hypothetical protein LBAT_1521 [Lactobacillus acetotolerans]